MKTRPKTYELLKEKSFFGVTNVNVMSNCDGEINIKVANKLKRGKFIATYPAWNFYGYVWFDKKEKQYYCEIWRYGCHEETIKGSLKEIMNEASNYYGHQ